MWWPTQLMIIMGMWKELLADLYKPATYMQNAYNPLRWWEKK